MTLNLTGPARLQRRRRLGWRVPQGAVYVGRPSRWGNPFDLERFSLSVSLMLFRTYAEDPQRGSEWLDPLRGKDLVCWCPLDSRCHADILIELANRT